MKVKDQVQQLLAELNVGIQEKESTMALALLAAVAGESIFLLGAPGVAKSLLARRLKFAFKDGKAFEYLMNRFSTPDELFGPVAISKLKEDQYVRIVDDYLPGASVVFLDEIWKVGPSIQNALLTVLNEKVYRNGAQEVKLPLKAILSASNELPAEGEGLDALWDRFLIRLKVEGIKDKKAFNTMISSTSNPYTDNITETLKISHAQYEAWRTGIDKVTVPDNVFQVIHMVRAYLQNHNQKQTSTKSFYVSDRRWRKLIHLMRTSAFLNGRDAVDLMDCFLILHCVWDEEAQIPVVEAFVKDAIEKHGYQLKLNVSDLGAELKDLDKEVLEETSFLKPVKKERLKVYLNEYYRILDFGNRYIKVKQFDSLGATDFQHIEVFTAHGNTLHRDQHFDLKKGNVKNSVVAKQHYSYNQGSQYSLEVEVYSEQVPATRKPHASTKKHFDQEIAKNKAAIANLLQELDTYRKKDLQHLRVNLFVDPSLAEIVERNIQLHEKQLRNLDIEADRIKKYYETVQDQSK
jgi:MoxR-like ATPase